MGQYFVCIVFCQYFILFVIRYCINNYFNLGNVYFSCAFESAFVI